jgi:tetratricopeptide (TPR) repeat protein
VYSVDTPQSLMVDACLLLGNIYYDQNNKEDAVNYYKKGLESIEENTAKETLSELYFKYALACDEREDEQNAFEYYTKCINCTGNNEFASSAYSNMGSCYYENGNISDAMDCFQRAYDMEKSKNNYDGIYYTASHLAEIYIHEHIKQAIDYLIEAKQSAEFLNAPEYIIEASVNLGDYYYNNKDTNKEALKEYFCALKYAQKSSSQEDIEKIQKRIDDMKYRMNEEDFAEIERKYV